eukprot:11512737-Karenia_brevis.AAC.1
MRLQHALRRRAVALEVAKLMSWEVHEEILDVYFEKLAEEQIEGYEKISVQQINKADVFLFSRLSELTEGDLSRPADGSLPLDGHATKILQEFKFSALLNPLPMRSMWSKRVLEEP